jgi:SAM-dependent methyltransferase
LIFIHPNITNGKILIISRLSDKNKEGVQMNIKTTIKHILKNILFFFFPDEKLRNNILKLIGGGVLYTSNREVFLKRLRKIQKNKGSSEWWSSQSIWNYSEVFPERYKIKKRFFDEKVIPLLSKEISMADIACASGEFSFFFSPFVKHIDSFDISPQMIQYAKRRSSELGITNIEFICGDANALSFNKEYDFCLMLGLLTCIHDDTTAVDIISKVYNSIKRDGYLLIKDSLWAHYKAKGDDMYLLEFGSKSFSKYRDPHNYFALYEKTGFIVVDKVLLAGDPDNGYHSILALLKKN